MTFKTNIQTGIYLTIIIFGLLSFTVLNSSNSADEIAFSKAQPLQNNHPNEKVSLTAEEYKVFQNALGKTWEDCKIWSPIIIDNWDNYYVEQNKVRILKPFVNFSTDDLKVKLIFKKGICTSVHIYSVQGSLGRAQMGNYNFSGKESVTGYSIAKFYQNKNKRMYTLRYRKYILPVYDIKYFLLVDGKNKEFKKLYKR